MAPAEAEETSEALIQRVGKGDRAAFTELYVRHGRGIAKVAGRRLKEQEAFVKSQCAEVADDVWVDIQMSAHTFAGRSSFWTWACTVTRRACGRGMRQLRRSNKKRVTVGPGDTDPLDYVADRSEGVEETLESSERLRLLEGLDEALETLTPDQRMVFVLRHMRGLLWKEIEEETGLAKSSAGDRLKEATKALKSELVRIDAKKSGKDGVHDVR